MKTNMFVSFAILSLILLFLMPAVLIAEKAAKGSQFIYACKCGEGCDCNTVATEPGDCACGKKMGEYNVLKLDGDNAIVCACGGGCECDLNSADPSLCTCGVPVKTVSLKGLYACACGPGCDCNTVADAPGVCACGKELRKVE